MIAAPVVLAGACVGVGAALMVRWALPAHPELGDALARLDGSGGDGAAARVPAAGRHSALLEGMSSRLVRGVGLRRYRCDLELVGETPEVLATRMAGYALLGLVFPLGLATVTTVIGVRPPLAIPLLVSLGLAAALFFLPQIDLQRRAAAAREDWRRAVCAYLELVALERAGDAGATESLERAATVGDSVPFVRIRDAMTEAELSGLPPWVGLTQLSAVVGVPELGDIADIMRLSGEDGAAAYATLRARAASMRTQLLTARAGQANAASEHMIVPVALLGIGFMALIGYPAFARILFG